MVRRLSRVLAVIAVMLQLKRLFATKLARRILAASASAIQPSLVNAPTAALAPKNNRDEQKVTKGRTDRYGPLFVPFSDAVWCLAPQEGCHIGDGNVDEAAAGG